MSKKDKKSNSRILLGRIWRKTWWLFLLLLVLCLAPHAASTVPNQFHNLQIALDNPWYKLLCLTLFAILIISICRNLTDYYNLLKRENGITWCQISILIVGSMWLLGVILIFNIQQNPNHFFVFGIMSTMLGWVFQDPIKGIAAFIHLRLNHLLNIGDWIQVPRYNVDGEVKRITLTTVTIYNWDTTTSSIPTSALHSDHFINLQKMALGKTYGREMVKTFILDTSWFHPISAEEAIQLKQQSELTQYLPEKEIHEGALNAQLYRLYIYHWLMSHPKLSQLPRLVVRWHEYRESGISLQIIAFITEGSLTAFEWQQAQIIEHIIESLHWFGLWLYQSPSSSVLSVSRKNNSVDKKEEANKPIDKKEKTDMPIDKEKNN